MAVNLYLDATGSILIPTAQNSTWPREVKSLTADGINWSPGTWHGWREITFPIAFA